MPFRLTQYPVLDRRTFLAGTGAAVTFGAIALGSPPAFTPLAKQPDDLRDRWTEILTARARLDFVEPRAQQLLQESDSDVGAFLRASENVPEGSVFPEYPLGGEDSGALSGTATRLAAMARAWVTPASTWSNDEQLRDVIVSGVETLVERGYHVGAKPVGNWWDWEIGTPRPLADLMCMMRDVLHPATLASAGEAIRFFIPDPRYSELMRYPTTGSGRVNVCRGALIAALAEEDATRLQECVDALPEAWQIVDSAGGFYADGGFIHHIDVPYTGSYGVELIENLAPLLTLIDGSEFDTLDRAPLWDRIDDAFLPVMVNGHMLDFVRGRAVARTRTNGSVIGRTTLAAITELSARAPSERRSSWLALFDEWAQRNPTLDLLAGPDVPSAVLLAEVEGATAQESAEPRSAYFSSMDRLVHRAPGWTLAIAMCSNRIAAYEATEQENAWASRTSNAMRYLYVDNDPAPFDDHFWATLDYSRPPGTTNHRAEHVEAPSRGNDTRVPRNEWTGGMVDGGVSVTAMHQAGLDGDAPHCRRLIVATVDRIIELVADVQSSSSAFTTVENRMFPEGDAPILVIDGTRVRDEVTVETPRWAHLEGVGGYIFLSQDSVMAQVSRRSGSRSRVEQTLTEVDEDDSVSRSWAGIDYIHRTRSSGAWMLLPGASLSTVRDAVAEDPSRDAGSIVRNDEAGQILNIGGGITVASAWRQLVVPLGDDLEVHLPHPLLILVQRQEDGVRIRVTEPTQNRDHTLIKVTGSWRVRGTSEIAKRNVTALESDGLTQVHVDSSDLLGRSFTVSLRPG